MTTSKLALLISILIIGMTYGLQIPFPSIIIRRLNMQSAAVNKSIRFQLGSKKIAVLVASLIIGVGPVEG